MQAKSFVIPAALGLLVGCGAPTEMSDMRAAMDNRLALGTTETQGEDGKPMVLQAGFAPSLRAAVIANEGYLGALALEAEAMGQVGVLQSVRRPQLTGNANIGALREIGANGSTTTGVAGGINLSQLVYDGGASTSAINGSTALAIAAQAAREVEGNEIARKAALAWIDLWQYSERLRQMQARTSELETLRDQIERMASNGMLDRAAIDSAYRQITDFRLEEARLQAGQSQARILFQRFFQTQAGTIDRPTQLASVAQATEFATDWRKAPVLLRQAAELLAAQAAASEAQAAFNPRARLQAGALSPLQSGEASDLTVGLSLEYSLYSGGRRQKQLEAAEAHVKVMEARLADAQRNLQAELQVGLAQLASIEGSMPLLAEKLSLSRSEAETARSQLLTGQSNLRQLVEAEIEVYRAQDRQISSQAERQILLLSIAAHAGALSKLIGL